MKGASFHLLNAGSCQEEPDVGCGALPTPSAQVGRLRLAASQALATLEASDRAALAQRADLVKQIPQYVPVTGSFLRQIHPLEGDLSEAFHYNELSYFQTSNRMSPFGAKGLH